MFSLSTRQCSASPLRLANPLSPASPLSPAGLTRSRSPISRSNSTKSNSGVQCTLREINQATKNDPWNPRLGGFVTSDTFIEAASQAQEPKPKAAPKRKLGHQITRDPSKNTAAEAALKPAAKRRRLHPNVFAPFPPPKTPFRQQLNTARRMGMSLICMLHMTVLSEIVFLKTCRGVLR